MKNHEHVAPMRAHAKAQKAATGAARAHPHTPRQRYEAEQSILMWLISATG